MPRYYVRQPNGKIGLFSTITDDWLYKDLTEEKFYEVFCERNGSFKVDFKPFTAFYCSARPNTQRKDFRAL